MAIREYIGARYVPIFDGDWDITKTYEPLVIVNYQGNSFTSKKYVPSGVQITDTDYWAESGNYSQQIEQLRQELNAAMQEIADLQEIATDPIAIEHGGTGSSTASDARTALGALGTTGGTMTGSVNYKSDVIDRDGANPSSTQISPYVIFTDKDGQRIGIVRSERNTNGVENLAIGTFNTKTGDGTEVDNWLRIGVNTNGARSVSISDSAAWVAGLGITPSAIGAVPLMTSLTSSDDLDTMRTPGIWRTQSSENLPSGALQDMSWSIVEVLFIGTTILQRVTTYNKIWFRTGNLSAWQGWQLVTSTPVS